MVVTLKPTAVTIDKKSKGQQLGLTLIYRGLDKYEEKDTGIFVNKVVSEGLACHSGVMQNDKILTINGKPPRTVDDAINLIKSAGCHIKFMILRALWIDDDVPIDRSTPMSTPIFIEKLAYHTTNVAPEKPARSLSTSPKSHASSMASFGSNWGNKSSTESINIIAEMGSRSSMKSKSKSSQSLREIGLNDYPNPKMPASVKLTRKEEKFSLQNLNNRLAGYIDRVRQLQQENHRLTKQVKVFESNQVTEINNVKDMYNTQIDDLKVMLDNMNKKYNQLKISSEGLLQENDDMKKKLNKKDFDAVANNEQINRLEDEMRQLANQLSLVETEKHKLHNQLQDTIPEIQTLQIKLGEVKQALNEEKLRSADLEDNCARLEKDHKFQLQSMQKELVEIKTVKRIEIEEMDGKIQKEYEDKLQKALQELREVYESRMKQSREDYEKIYETQVKDLQLQLSTARGSNASNQEELKGYKNQMEAMIVTVSKLKNANLNLNKNISDLEKEIDDIKSIHRTQLVVKDDEINRLSEELTNQQKEYQTLQDIKTALDMEIAVFRSLIECEEDRLGMSERNTAKSNPVTDVTNLKTQGGVYKAIPATTVTERSVPILMERSYQHHVTKTQTML